jgi:hypothetical protein
VLTGAFAHDPFIAQGDTAYYANHAVYMANHGRLDIPYPSSLGIPVVDRSMFQEVLDHVELTDASIQVRFGHLFPAWLAQTWAVAGYEGLVRLNVVFGFFSLLAIYGLLKRLARARIAAVATLFLAFNPAQIWVVRQTLTETLTQLLIWAGLLLLTAYLARGRPAWGFWSGALLGTAALVRIDVFLVVPFLLVGHALWRALQVGPGDRLVPSWKPIYLGVVPTFVGAFAYYLLFSRPYLFALAQPMLGIGALAVAGACLLAITYLPGASRFARGLLARPPVLAGLLGALAFLAAYAYFIRPIVPPFATYLDPLESPVPIRNRIEDALPNLGRYLTPGVVWAALGGWSLAFVGAVRHPRRRALLPLIAICLGCTAVYVGNQSVRPDHFLAVRRFIPVIIPAIVLFAGLAATLALPRLSIGGRRLALRASVAALAAFTLFVGVPTYTVQQRQGSYAALADFASSVPVGGEVLLIGDSSDSVRWWMPLYLAFDRPVTPVDITTEKGFMATVARLRAASPENPVVIVSGKATPLAPVEGRIIGQVELSHTVIDNSSEPVPTTSHVQQFTLTAVEATGLNTIGAELVARSQWMVLMDGVYRVEKLEAGTPVRKTNGHGRVLVPIDGDSLPTRLAISIADTGPHGGPLRVLLNGITLFDGQVPAGWWSGDLEVPEVADLPRGSIAVIEIISTFDPDPLPGFPRPVGVQVESLTLLADDH